MNATHNIAGFVFEQSLIDSISKQIDQILEISKDDPILPGTIIAIDLGQDKKIEILFLRGDTRVNGGILLDFGGFLVSTKKTLDGSQFGEIYGIEGDDYILAATGMLKNKEFGRRLFKPGLAHEIGHVLMGHVEAVLSEFTLEEIHAREHLGVEKDHREVDADTFSELVVGQDEIKYMLNFYSSVMEDSIKNHLAEMTDQQIADVRKGLLQINHRLDTINSR